MGAQLLGMEVFNGRDKSQLRAAAFTGDTVGIRSLT